MKRSTGEPTFRKMAAADLGRVAGLVKSYIAMRWDVPQGLARE